MSVDHYENFPVASFLLPRRLRAPVEAIYRFARSADDIADEGDDCAEQRLEKLAHYRQALNKIGRGEKTETLETPLFTALSTVITTWNLPLSLFVDLLDAFSQDVIKKRYADYAELLDYCRRSANPIGRLLLHLVDRTDEECLYQSDCVCSALQLINFWQDIAEDWTRGRVYVPQTDLARFNVRESDIENTMKNGVWTDALAALMDFEIERSRALMREGAPLVHRLPGRMGWEIRATVQGGYRILDRLQKVRGNVFTHRPTLGAADWLVISARTLFM